MCSADEDYVEVFEVPVIFQPGEDEQGVIIDILDDDVFEETESFFVTLTTNQSNVILDDVTEAEVIIRDNDGMYHKLNSIRCLLHNRI